MSKRKSVRFAENKGDQDDDSAAADCYDGPAPSDRELLRMSAKRRLGDQTMTSLAAKTMTPSSLGGIDQGDRTTYDEIGTETGRDDEFPKLHASGKHTLDSDEEDDNAEAKKADRLDVDNVEGQEESTIDFDRDTKITPFNMKEEMEEGYYDTEGNFVFDKNNKEIKDAWLDDIDWTTVKEKAGRLWNEQLTDDDSQLKNGEETEVFDKFEVYRQILTFMQPTETITKTLKRLGGGKSASETRRQRWRQKKEEQALAAAASKNIVKPSLTPKENNGDDSSSKPITDSVPSSDSSPTNKIDQSESRSDVKQEPFDPVVALTALVDRLVSEGEFEIYGATYEKLTFEFNRKLKRQEMEEKLNSKTTILDRCKNEDDDDALDMFAEKLDHDTLAKKEVEQEGQHIAPAEGASTPGIAWEFKWENVSDAEIHGPFSSVQMDQWSQENYFKEGVWVRRIDQTSSQFYSSKRIDFDLYI